MLTKEQAINLPLRTILHYHRPKINTDICHRWRINGKSKTWKTRPEEFKIPIKFGLYEHGYLTHENAANFFLAKDCPVSHV
jgi:hypothetical protein